MSLFGSPLPKDGPVPDLFEICLNHLELHALEVEGIFRVSGQKARVEEMRNEFENGTRYEFTTKDEIHDISGLFRLYLQLLPEPIIPFEYFSKVVDSGKLNGAKAKTLLKNLVQELPKLRRLMLQKLIRLLRLISLYHDTNKMNPSNLAVVMGPNIARPEKMAAVPTEALTQATCVTNAIVTLIEEYEFILPRELPQSPSVESISKSDSHTSIDIVARSASGRSVNMGEASATSSSRPKLSISLTELPTESPEKPGLGPPKSARSGGSSRSRSARGSTTTPRNRGFSNALEWLVSSAQEGSLEEGMSSAEDPSLDDIAAEVKSTTSSKRNSSRRSRPAPERSESSDAGSDVASPTRERSKKLRSSSSINSAETSSTATSEPASPRDPKSLTDSTGHRKKKKKSSSKGGDTTPSESEEASRG